MLSEEFDKKIKDAAFQHHPAYDENAWQKMEKLLNQHLPQQKDDRRRVLLLLLFLAMVGGGIFLVVSKPWNKPLASNVSTEKTNIVPASTPALSSEQPVLPKITASSKTQVDQSTHIPQDLKKFVASTSPIQKATGSTIDRSNKPRNSLTNQGETATKDQPTTNNPADNIKATVLSKDNSDKEQEPGSTELAKTGSNQVLSPVISSTGENNSPQNGSKNKAEENKPVASADPADAKKPQPRKRLGKGNDLSFFVSAGPDVSKAGTSKMGKTTSLYGAGVAYTRNRITLRTGIFASKKIYWANPEDYDLVFTPPPSTKFVGANANCDVVQIPVELSYSFGLSENSNWFAGAGLSSYLMKKENYVFTYKTPTFVYYYPYETRNENKHYFSVLGLSGGYTRYFGKKISLTAEPYVNIPMTGIGSGKVHLNSGGVLFTAGIHPFRK